jgi:hypothetical protein
LGAAGGEATSKPPTAQRTGLRGLRCLLEPRAALAGVVVGHDPDALSASAKEPSRCRSGLPLRLPVAKLPVA